MSLGAPLSVGSPGKYSWVPSALVWSLECSLLFALHPQSLNSKLHPPIPRPTSRSSLTTLRISVAWIVALKGKMTDFVSALRSGNRLCLP